MMPLAWSYARTSTTRQAGADRSGMERQERALRGWLADHPDYQLAEALVDAGVSAGRGKHRTRGALARFIDGGRTGAVPPGSCLVVESMSRFSREAATSTLSTLLNDVWGQGLAISFTTDGAVLDKALIDAEDHRLHAILGAIGQARREWEERSRRSQGAAVRARRLRSEGIRTPGDVPWWIARDDHGDLVRDTAGAFTLRPPAVETIRRAVALALSGMGSTLIARRLNDEGLAPAPPRGRRSQYGPAVNVWTPTKVAALLRKPALNGTLVQRDGTVIAGYYPPVIPAEQWQALREAMTQRCRKRGTLRSGLVIRNLFQIAARCAVCGAPMTYHGASQRTKPDHSGYVACRSAMRRSGLNCTNKGFINYHHFETHCLLRLRASDWESFLRRPEDDRERGGLEAAATTAEGHAAHLCSRLELAQRRHDDDWEQGVPCERLETGERVIRRLNEELAQADREAATAREALAVASAQPSAGDRAAAIRLRVAAFRSRLGSATPDERQAFNRWLLSLQPEVRFLVIARPEGQPRPLIGLKVGDADPVWQALQPAAEAEAMRSGFVRYMQAAETFESEQVELIISLMRHINAEGEVSPDGDFWVTTVKGR